jgi:hypothetical protein
MKMPDKKTDLELQGFFAEMKKQDAQSQIPPLPKFRKTKNWLWVPVGIAASLIMGIWYFTPIDSDYKLEEDIIIISLIQDKNNELQFSIESTTSMDSWEASSSSLLTEF